MLIVFDMLAKIIATLSPKLRFRFVALANTIISAGGFISFQSNAQHLLSVCFILLYLVFYFYRFYTRPEFLHMGYLLSKLTPSFSICV